MSLTPAPCHGRHRAARSGAPWGAERHRHDATRLMAFAPPQAEVSAEGKRRPAPGASRRHKPHAPLSGARTMFIENDMALLLAPDGPLRDALRAALDGGDVRCAPFEHPDLFGAALGTSAIVYAPNLPADPERMRRVLGAANAPGVTLLVVVRPPGDDFEPEERLMRRDGKPYVVLAAPPDAPDLGAALRRALSDGALQGRVFAVTNEAPAPAPATPAPPSPRPVAPRAAALTSARLATPAPTAPDATAATSPPAPPPGRPAGPQRARARAPRGRWLWPAMGLAIAGAALALGSGVMSSGCSAAPRAAATSPGAR